MACFKIFNKRLFALFSVTFLVFTVDSVCKYVSAKTFPNTTFSRDNPDSFKLLFNLKFTQLMFTKTYNNGFIYGIFSGHKRGSIKSIVFIVFSIVAIFFAVYFVISDFLKFKCFTSSLRYGFALGGAFGNVVNRIFINEGVIDCFFFTDDILGVWTGIFNLADVFILIAIIWLSLSSKKEDIDDNSKYIGNTE